MNPRDFDLSESDWRAGKYTLEHVRVECAISGGRIPREGKYVGGAAMLVDIVDGLLQSYMIRDRTKQYLRELHGVMKMEMTMPSGVRVLRGETANWLAWKIDTLLGIRNDPEPAVPEAPARIEWFPSLDDTTLTKADKLWHKEPVAGRAKDEAKRAFRKKPKPEPSERLQRARKAIRDLKKVAETFTPTDIEALVYELEQAQETPPRDKAGFVDEMATLMDALNLRFVVNGEPIGRLRLSNRYTLQIRLPGNEGALSFADTGIEIARAKSRRKASPSPKSEPK